jgi:hypothetical protein
MKKLMEKAESEGLHMSDVLARELMDNFHPLAADVDETSVVCDELIEFILCQLNSVCCESPSAANG